jgi:hypothetical protein
MIQQHKPPSPRSDVIEKGGLSGPFIKNTKFRSRAGSFFLILFFGLPNACNYKYGGNPAPDGASPTQPYKCGQNVKVNFFISALANLFISAKQKPRYR